MIASLTDSNKAGFSNMSHAQFCFETSDGVTLHYALDDYTDPWVTPQTIFLLHAVMGDSRRAYRWVPVLARHFRVVRPDMRGHGQSDVPAEGALSLSRLVEDVTELADHLDCATFHIAGASVGGIIALQLALDEALRSIPNCEFVVYDGYQHNIVDAVPERCAHELLRYLAKQSVHQVP